jgi:hypothetical protein
MGPQMGDICVSVPNERPAKSGYGMVTDDTISKVEEYLLRSLVAQHRAIPITSETELYRDLRMYGDDLFEMVLWVNREFGVETNLHIASYAPGESPFFRLFRFLAKIVGRRERQYASLKVRDVLSAIETNVGKNVADGSTALRVCVAANQIATRLVPMRPSDQRLWSQQ